MGEPHVISALVAKRAELAGQALALDRQKATLRAQINHIDHSLAIFGYKDAPRDIKPKDRHVYRFKRRELPRFIRQIESGGKLPNREIAMRIIAAKGWDAADRELTAKVADSIKSAKNWQRQCQRTS